MIRSRVKANENWWRMTALGKVKDFMALVKLRLTTTVVFSSVMAYLIAASVINWTAVAILALGGFMVTGAANALNQALEIDYDKLMKRTADRPMAAGRMTMSEGIIAAGFMSLFGITLLALFNPWASSLGMLALVTYAFVYTPLKRIGQSAVIVGAVAGALPVMIGCVSAERKGRLTSLAILLFSIQFFWQFPHFWSIGWLGFEDYQKAGYKFIPTKDGAASRSIGLQSLVYAIFLVVIGVLPFVFGLTTLATTVLLVGISALFALRAWRFFRRPIRETALKLMFFSLLYIPVVLVILFLDKALF